MESTANGWRMTGHPEVGRQPAPVECLLKSTVTSVSPTPLGGNSEMIRGTPRLAGRSEASDPFRQPVLNRREITRHESLQ